MKSSKINFSLLVFFFGMLSINKAIAGGVVTNTNDSGPGSLRAAASSGGTVTFSPSLLTLGSDTIVLSSAISVSDTINITGLMTTTDTLFISGNNASRIFEFTFAHGYNKNSFLNDLAIMNGFVTGSNKHGGAILGRGVIEINNCVFTNNHAREGGAIFLVGSSYSPRLIVNNSSFANNSAERYGGAISGEASSSGNSVRFEINNSTFNNNSASWGGGAVHSSCSSTSTVSSGTARSYIFVNQSTFCSNTGSAAIRHSGNKANSSVNKANLYTAISNSTIVNNGTVAINSNTNGGTSTISVSSNIILGTILNYPLVNSISSSGYNIFSINSITGSTTTDQFNKGSSDVLLSALGYNGGTTKTKIPLLGSIAINSGRPTGFSGLVDAQNGPIVGIRDVGAAEHTTFYAIDTHTLCTQSFTWINGITYTSSNNTAKDTLVSTIGYDSIITLDLTIKNPTYSTDTKSACGSYTWIDGVTYTLSNNTAKDTLVNSVGCDSVITLNLTINNSTTGTDVQTACDSYTWINGVTYATSNNTAKDTLVNLNGCDSIVTLNLTINNSTTGTDVQTACDSYTWINGITYTASNNTATHTITNAVGCDSVITLDLTINNSTNSTDVQIACNSYSWINGITYTGSNNTATHTLTNAVGCDSIITLNLTINNSTASTDVQTACGSYTWINGVTYTTSNNTAKDTLVNLNGCDSIVTLNLTINNSTTSTDVQIACNSYTWINGVTYATSNNTAKDTLVNLNGCDSVVTLDLTINNSTTGTDVQTACDSYTWIDGITYTASNNTTTHTLTNAVGCDSVVTLNLTISNSTVSTDVQTACGSYTWLNGVTYTASNNSATRTLTNAVGCDSIITLNLTINNSTASTDVQTACGSYTWINGVTYTTSNNTAKDTLVNLNGCDSIVTLNLTINNSTTGTDVQIACNSYTWINGVTYATSNNTAKDTLVNLNGCDSVVTLDLTINNSTASTDVQTACDSYTWINGITYTASNNSATHTVTNAVGCDSVITLDLTINNSTSSTDVQTTCDSYTWINGITYTASNNTATHTLTNAVGCDSIITLNLTINNSTASTDVQTACGSYTWINGVTYTTSNNTAKDTLVNSNGCDSIITLNLTVNQVDISVSQTGITLTANAIGASYQWVNCNTGYTVIPGETGFSFLPTVNSDYAVIVTQNGCTDTSACHRIISVGINQNQLDNIISIYPNPNEGFFTVEFTEINKQKVQLRIIDVSGKIIIEEVYEDSEKITFDLSKKGKGYYFLQLKTEYGITTKKIVIQ